MVDGLLNGPTPGLTVQRRLERSVDVRGVFGQRVSSDQECLDEGTGTGSNTKARPVPGLCLSVLVPDYGSASWTDSSEGLDSVLGSTKKRPPNQRRAEAMPRIGTMHTKVT